MLTSLLAPLSRHHAVDFGSTPASGAVGRALAAYCVHQIRSLFGARVHAGGSARGRAEQQPRRLRSPLIPTASFLLSQQCSGSWGQRPPRARATGGLADWHQSAATHQMEKVQETDQAVHSPVGYVFSCLKNPAHLLQIWFLRMVTVVAAQAAGARRLRRFRLAQKRDVTEKPRLREARTVKRPEGRAPTQIVVGR